MSEMSSEMRSKLTKMSIVDCIAESPTIAQYFANHPEIDPNKGVDLGKVLDSVNILLYKNNLDNDPYIDILKSYRRNCESSGSSEFDSLVIRDFTQEDGLGKYVTIQTGETDGVANYQVAFSGTAGAEGIDNAQGMYQESTVQQQRCLDYFYEMADKYDMQEGHVDLSGHSKGGNESGYVCMNASGKYQKMISICLTADGQGYSNEALEQWKKNSDYSDRTSKIYGIYGEYDYVHPLGNSVVPEEHRFYLNYDEGLLADCDDIGKKGMSYHLLNYMFKTDERGRFIAELQTDGTPSKLVNYEKKFMESFMDMDPGLQEKAKYLMQVIWEERSPDGEIAEEGFEALRDLLILIGGTNTEAFQSFVKELTNMLNIESPSSWEVAKELFNRAKDSILLTDDSGKVDLLHLALHSLPLILFLSKRMYKYKDANIQKQLLNQVSGSENTDDKPYMTLRQKAKKAAAGEAARYPSFQVRPKLMLQYSSIYRYLGGELRSISDSLKKAAKFDISSALMFATKSSVYSDEQKTKIRRLHKRAMELQENLPKAAELLEECIRTVNATLQYLRDTGNGFNRLEDDLSSKADQWLVSTVVGMKNEK